MNFSSIFDYLVGLQRSAFTGAVTFNYHKGEASKKVEVKRIEVLEEKSKVHHKEQKIK